MTKLGSDKQILVSIIVPVYNVAEYIQETLVSINSQTMRGFELILVDDGSQDNSISIASEYLDTTDLDYCIVRQENKGLPAARNAGIQKASGKYLCFIDSDDIVSPFYLKNLLCPLEEYSCKFGFCDFESTKKKNRYGTQEKYRFPVLLNKEDIQQGFLYRRNKIHCCAIMIEHDFLISKGLLFNENLRFGEDVEYLWRILSLVDYVLYSPNKDYKYLTRDNSLMTAQKIERLEIFFREFNHTISHLYGLSEERKKTVKNRVALGIYHSFAKNSEYDTFLNLISRTRYKETIDCDNIFEWKSKILAMFLRVSPRMFWSISKKY